MGYYTDYNLTSKPSWPDDLGRMIAMEDERVGNLPWAVNPDGSFYDSTTWHEHEKDMRAVSLMFPDTEFTLTGEGEKSGDAWIKHFRDGNMQVRRAVLVYPEYDPDGFE